MTLTRQSWTRSGRVLGPCRLDLGQVPVHVVLWYRAARSGKPLEGSWAASQQTSRRLIMVPGVFCRVLLRLHQVWQGGAAAAGRKWPRKWVR